MAKAKQLAFHGAREVRRRTFGDLPIVDAKADFTLTVLSEDIKAAKGKAKDPVNCALAKACGRQIKATTVAFFRGIAYVELPNSKGKKELVRFVLDDDAAAIVSAFDRGKAVKGEVTVKLKAPTPSRTMDAISEMNERRRSRKRKAVLSGQIIESDLSKKRIFKKPSVGTMDVRNGTGRVHNTVKKPRTVSKRKAAKK